MLEFLSFILVLVIGLLISNTLWRKLFSRENNTAKIALAVLIVLIYPITYFLIKFGTDNNNNSFSEYITLLLIFLYNLAVPYSIFYKYLPFKNKVLDIFAATIIVLAYIYIYATLQNSCDTACIYGLADAGFPENFIKNFKIACNFYCATFPTAAFTIYILIMRFTKTKTSKIFLLLFTTTVCLHLFLKFLYVFRIF